MAILCESELGWVVDHKVNLDLTYAHVQEPPGGSSNKTEHITEDTGGCRPLKPDGSTRSGAYTAKSSLFEIHHPFMMDSEFDKLHVKKVHLDSSNVNVKCIQEKKKNRKRKAPLNPGQEAALDFHMKVRDILDKALKQLVHLAKQQGHFPEVTKAHPDNNKSARQAAAIQGPGNALVDLSDLARHNPGGEDGPHQLVGEGNCQAPSLFNRLLVFESDDCVVRPWMGAHYLLPPHSRFLMSDITCMAPLLSDGTKYDVIVMDPPWENKSVKRKKKYASLNDWSLQELPIPALAAPGCLVVVWVTNKQRQHSFVRHTLFPRWSTSYIGMWYWLKVTTCGQLVRNLDDPQKKPYECLILGRFGDGNPGQMKRNTEDTTCILQTDDSVALSAGETGQPDLVEHKACPSLQGERVIISVPCSIHSRKPPLNALKLGDSQLYADQCLAITGADLVATGCNSLKIVVFCVQMVTLLYLLLGFRPPTIQQLPSDLMDLIATRDILKRFLPARNNCLELFARNLLPGWTSWGNEVLKFQHTDFFEKG